MGVDTDEDNVQRLAHELTHVVTADSSDERTLRSLGAQNFDVAVVAIGDLEANMLTTLLLKEIGVPVVVVKAINQVHGKMLKKIGADKIVYSERDMGQRVAHNLISNSIVDYIELLACKNDLLKGKKSSLRPAARGNPSTRSASSAIIPAAAWALLLLKRLLLPGPKLPWLPVRRTT